MGKGMKRSARRNKGLPVSRVLRISTTVVVADPGAANAFATAVIGELPQGNVVLLGAVLNLDTVTKGDADIIDAFTGNYAVGSAATADATLSGAEVDIIPSTAFVTGVGGVSSGNRAVLAAPVTLNNTDESLEVNLNFFVADASISAASSLIFVGNLWMLYAVLGDD